MVPQKKVEAEVGKNNNHTKRSKRGELTIIEITEKMNDLPMMTEEKKGMTIGIEGLATEIKMNVITEVGIEEGKTLAVIDTTDATKGIIVTVTTKTVEETTEVIEEMRVKESGPGKIVNIMKEVVIVVRRLFRK